MRKALALALVISLLIPTGAAWAAPPAADGVALAVAEAAQRTPDISGRWVVWEDERWGYDDLWVRDLATGEQRRLSDASGKQAYPSISGKRVVAEDYRNQVNSNLFQFDVDSGASAAIAPTGMYDRYTPDVYGDRVAWADERNGNYDVFVMDLASGSETVMAGADGYRQSEPATGEKWVVWHDERNSAGSDGDIYGYKFATGFEQAICAEDGEQQNPDVSGDTVVWQDYRNDQWDIFAKDTLTGIETTVCAADGAQTNPAISGNWVVWQDTRDGDFDIYAYNLATKAEQLVCDADGAQTNPAISGNWVAWQDSRDDASDIYAASLAPQPDLSASAVSGPVAAGAGAAVSVSINVANHGDASAPASSVGVYLSSDAVISRDDRRIGAAATGSLGIGATKTLTVPCTIPGDAAPGTYYVGAIADADGALLELDEADNIAVGSPVTVSLPSNDAFVSALLLSGVAGTRSAQLTWGATKETGEPKHAGNPGGASIWYKWKAPSTGIATVDLYGSDFDTVLGIYKGTSVSTLTRVTSNDDVGARLQSRVRFTATKGTTYYFAVDGFGTARGSARVKWTHQAQYVGTPKTPSRVTRKRAFTAYGYLKPRHRAGTYAVTLRCYRLESGRWKLRKTVRAKISNYSSYSRYAVRTSLPYKGRWLIRSVHGDGDHAVTWSGSRRLTVR